MSTRKYFGTDGIRGQVGLSHVNPEFVLKLGWAVGSVIRDAGYRKEVVIGKDTRVSGYMLESALQAGLVAAGVNVRLLGPIPTPGIAYLTQTMLASVGIVISASHNLFADNGIKFFAADGGKFSDATELAIEAQMDKPLQTMACANLGKAKRIADAAGRYIEFCKATIPSRTRLSELKIVVDCANGATYHIAPNVFSELGAEVIAVADKPDGFNINADCGSTSPQLLQKKVLETKADLGIGLDGDGDRVILVDAKGQLIDGDKIIYIIAKDRKERGLLTGGIVGTLMSNIGLELAVKNLQAPFLRSPVGDRYVLETLKSNGWTIGGEPSGHIVCLDKTTTGDGIIAALQVIAVMMRKGLPLDQLTDGITVMPQTLVNIKTKHASKLLAHEKVKSLVASIEKSLEHKGRVLLRPSGTEPLLRIMVEGEDSSLVAQYAQNIYDFLLQIDQQLDTIPS